MSGSRWFILLIFAAFALTTVDMPSFRNADRNAVGIGWQPYASAMARTGTESKPVFLHFWAEWCRYCKKMAAETFRNPSVIQYLNANYVPIRVNYDTQKLLVEQFNVGGLPATFVIETDGRRTGPLSGFIPPDRLLAVLKTIQADRP